MTFHERLLALPNLQAQLKTLTVQSVASSFPALNGNGVGSKPDWPYLLKCASILAYSDLGRCQAAALRVAHACLSSKSASEQERVASGVVLDTLTNYPAVKLAVKKDLLTASFRKDLPMMLKLDMIARAVESSIPDDAETRLTRFQKRLFVALEEARYVSVSAPTSAGKSYVLMQFVRRFTLERNLAKVVYLVPTRALIQQCERDFQEALSGRRPKPIVTSIPQIPEGWDENTCVLVYTQERFHWVLSNSSIGNVDLLVIDEAQKVGDSARGVLLQQVIEEALRRSPNMKVLFSSPMSSNPGILLNSFSTTQGGTVIDSDDVTVNQNLIWVSQAARDPLFWDVSLCIDGGNVVLGQIKLPARPTADRKRLPFVAYALAGPTPGNLIYMNGQADAEKAAQLIWELMGKDHETDDREIVELVELVKKVVHKDYALANVLTRRVAFHYGNMPLVIRSEIERLFKEGKIFYLLCTSTLLEGVNLPAKSIFLRSPSRGRGKPLSSIDFWNLAGRAGRLGKEFQGNVICVDPEDANVWEQRPPVHRARYEIKFSLDQVLAKPDVLIKYLTDGTPRAVARATPELEQAAVYLWSKRLSEKTLISGDLARRFPAEVLAALDAECGALIARVEIPEEIVRRNPGVSPLAQQALLNYFREFERDPIELIPTLPESRDAAKDSYMHVIGRINNHLSGGMNARNSYLAILVVNWMRGHPLARMIMANYEYWQPKGKTLAAVIRDTMRDIEEFARFSFVKFSSCYIDVLRLHFSQLKRPDLLQRIPELNIWLEFGASQQTQISLISLGMSRTAAIELADFIAKDNLSRAECIEWLNSTNLEGLDLSPIIRREIEAVKAELR